MSKSFSQHWLSFTISVLLLAGVVIAVVAISVQISQTNMQSIVKGNEESPVIAEVETQQFDGQTVTLTGVIEYAFNSGKQTIFSFHPEHQGNFKFIIKKEYYDAFSGDPVPLYPIGSEVAVQGTMEWYQGDQVMYITLPEQITLL